MYLANSFNRGFIPLLIIFFNTFVYANSDSFKDLFLLDNQKNKLEFTYNCVKKDNKCKTYQINLIAKDYLRTSINRGFKIYIPQYTKSIDFISSRFNSRGSIGGLLYVNDSKNIQNTQSNSVNKSYLCAKNRRKYKNQVDFLVNCGAIKYENFNFLAIESHNLNNLFKKYIYFEFSSNDSKLTDGLNYSLSFTFDAKVIDNYVDKYLKLEKNPNIKNEFVKLHTFVTNFHKISEVKIAKKAPNKNPQKKAKQIVRLNTKKILFMKEFEAEKINLFKNEDRLLSEVQDYNLKINKQIESLKFDIENLLNVDNKTQVIDVHKVNTVLLDSIKNKIGQIQKSNNFKFPKEYYKYAVSYDELYNFYTLQSANSKELDKIYFNINKIVKNSNDYIELSKMLNNGNFKEELKTKLLSSLEKISFDFNYSKNEFNEKVCLNEIEKWNENCIKYKWYISNHLNSLLKKDEPLDLELIKKYADAKIYNNLAIYFYRAGDINNSSEFLELALKSVKNEKDKQTILFNKAILLSYLNTHSSAKEASEIFEKLDFKEAYYNLAINYYLGLGVKHSYNKAYKYFEKASKLNFFPAKENLKKMKKY